MRAFVPFAVLIAWTPAHAQIVATPYLHVNAGDVEIRRGGLGGSVGYLGRRLGFELDVDRHEHFYKDEDLEDIPDPCRPGAVGTCIDDDTDAWIFLGHAVVPIPVPETSRWRPYASAGGGLICAWVHDAGPYDSRQYDPAFDLGGGAMFRLTDRLALRGETRWFHAFVDEDAEDGGYPSDYDFARLALGVTFSPFAAFE